MLLFQLLGFKKQQYKTMKRLIQYYDSKKSNKLSIEDLAIYLHHAIPSHIGMFGDGNYAIYMDSESKDALKILGIEHDCIKYNFQPLDDGCHTLRWLSMMAMQTESFQICPIGTKVENRNTDKIEVSQLVIAPYIPVLAKYGLEQTGGLAGGDIISVCNAFVTMQAYADARNVIYENEITDEAEIQQLMGAFLFKTAKEMNIEILKFP